MTLSERIAVLEARASAAEARIAALEQRGYPVQPLPVITPMPPCTPPPGWPWHEVTCESDSIPAVTIKPLWSAT